MSPLVVKKIIEKKYLLTAGIAALSYFACLISPVSILAESTKDLTSADRNLAACTQNDMILSDSFESGINGSRIPVMDIIDRPPPIASLITVGTPTPDGSTTVAGASGAVPADAVVMVASLAYTTPHS